MSEWPAWAKIVAGLGFPIVVAIWLMVYVSARVDRTASAMDTHVHETQIQTALLRQICRNGAKSELQAQFCEYGLPAWRRPQ